jgi:hypothetical protein
MNDETIFDVLSQAQSMETMLTICIENIEVTLEKYPHENGERHVEQNFPDMLSQAEEMEAKLMEIIDYLSIFAISDQSTLETEITVVKGVPFMKQNFACNLFCMQRWALIFVLCRRLSKLGLRHHRT